MGDESVRRFSPFLIPVIMIAWASPDPKWHSMKDKEILQTDGILKSEPYNSTGGGTSAFRFFVQLPSVLC